MDKKITDFLVKEIKIGKDKVRYEIVEGQEQI